MPVTTVNLLSEGSSSKSEKAPNGTERPFSSPQHCSASDILPQPMASIPGTNDCGTSSKRRKRKVDQDLNDTTSLAMTANGSAAKKFIWNHEDEMNLLCKMLEFTSMKGHYPKKSHDMDVLYDMMAGSLSFRLKSHLKKDQMTNKARSMRKRHMKILQMVDSKKLTENEQTILGIGNLIWAMKIKKIKETKKIKKETGERNNTGLVVEKLKEDDTGKITSHKICPCRPISNGNLKVGNDIFGAVNINDSDKAVDASNILEFIIQLFVLSGKHGVGYTPSYLENNMSLLESAERKAVEDICRKIQQEERECNFRLMDASLEIIKIFRSSNPESS